MRPETEKYAAVLGDSSGLEGPSSVGGFFQKKPGREWLCRQWGQRDGVPTVRAVQHVDRFGGDRIEGAPLLEHQLCTRTGSWECGGIPTARASVWTSATDDSRRARSQGSSNARKWGGLLPRCHHVAKLGHFRLQMPPPPPPNMARENRSCAAEKV